MAAPSEPFTIIADASVDPDSPLTTGLMLALKRNDIHLEEWLGLSFTAAQDHDHDGLNSKGVSLLPKKAEDVTNRDSTVIALADLSGASITYTAAELGVNRECLTIVALQIIRPSGTANGVSFALTIDGVDQQFMVQSFASTNNAESVILAGQNTLVSGANRIVKVRFASNTGGQIVRVQRSYLQAFLVS